ncbi:MAG: hypothetical protein Ct9H300mP8_05780 [Gammaproteobacteria bacterium]|nr:MAG: hypothetical protein Ct9H300mP8_05780 [Gammaproteobacteria bacterium]
MGGFGEVVMKHRSVFLVGLMAVGKSSVGRQLAESSATRFTILIRKLRLVPVQRSPGYLTSKVRMDFEKGKHRLLTS